MKFVKVKGQNGAELLLNLDLVESIHRSRRVAGEVDVFTAGDPDTPYKLDESFETMEKLVGLTVCEEQESLPRRGPTP